MLRCLALAALVLASGAHGLPLAPRPPLEEGDVTATAALEAALGLAHRAVPLSVGVTGDGSLADAVGRAYDALGLPLSHAQRAGMRAQERALDPGVATAAAALLDALTAPAPTLARALAAARAADGLADALRAAPPVAPRQGWVFSDPFELVLVGGSGSDTYAGNTLPLGAVHPRANLLTIDLGGNDTYLNNAGGAGSEVTCPGLRCGNGLTGAAAVDLAGDDTYLWVEQPLTRAVLPAQGAAIYGGVGLLLDLAGDDRYEAHALGPREVTHPAQLAQGAGVTGGVGILLDAGGRDTYTATMGVLGNPGGLPIQWVQGGGDSDGVGVLVDGGGDDTYSATQDGVDAMMLIQLAQGAGANQGVGVLIERGGNDTYTATQSVGTTGARPLRDLHVQGVGEYQGTGALLELGGDDAYTVVQPQRGPGDLRIAQGEGFQGQGLLVDAGGRDAYSEAHAGDGSPWVHGAVGVGADVELAVPRGKIDARLDGWRSLRY